MNRQNPRVVFLVLLLMFAFSSTPMAQIFSCTSLSGSSFFTDNKNLLPQGCRIDPQKALATKTSLSIIPAPQSESTGTAETVIVAIEREEIAQLQTAQALHLRAKQLVDRYVNIRNDKFLDARGNLRIEFRRELKKIQNQKKELLDDLSDANRMSIQQRLSIIPG